MNEQGTPGWFEERRGLFTGSCMINVLAIGDGGVYERGPRKGQPRDVPAARTNYIKSVAAERITGKVKKSVGAKSLDYGHEMEPEAIAAYERKRGVLIERVGFLVHPLHSYIGASADFIISEMRRGGEVKCPYSQDVHLETLLTGVPEEHMPQIQTGLWVYDWDEWIFLSYHPDFPEHLQLYEQRIKRDEAMIDRIREHTLSAEQEVCEIVRKLNPGG